MNNIKESANFIWSIADLLRGDYKQSDYGKVVLPNCIKTLRLRARQYQSRCIKES